MELIPAIDLRAGRCVRLYQGDFAAEKHYSDEPVKVLQDYVGLGATRVHIVDLDGARDGTQGNRTIIKNLAQLNTAQLQVGGGLRDLSTVTALLTCGVKRVVIGSTAITAPDTVIEWTQQIAADQFVLAFDVRIDDHSVPLLTTHGWQRTSTLNLWALTERFAQAGFKHILCTDVSRDGALTGPNCALYAEAVQRFPNIHWQASGGVASAQDLHALQACGVTAVISGTALLEKKISPKELRPFLQNALSPV